jgi:hypothetical protein
LVVCGARALAAKRSTTAVARQTPGEPVDG